MLEAELPDGVDGLPAQNVQPRGRLTPEELLHMAEAQGLPQARALELLRPLPVTSAAAGGLGGLMLSGDHAPRFPVDLVAKDLRYAALSGSGPVVDAVRARFEEASRAGLGAQNLSAVHLLGRLDAAP